MPAGQLGYLTEVAMSALATPTVWFDFEYIFNVTPPNDEDEQIDVTHYKSPNRRREFIAGFTDGGEITIEGNYIPNNDTDEWIRASKGVERNVRITLPDGTEIAFAALRTGYEVNIPIEDKMAFNSTWKVSGDVTQSASAAPVNVTKPAIAGIAQVNQVLTAYPGVWTGGGAITYQWKNEGANISGETNATYTPVVGDIGENITVTVTRTNSEGNASATSAETLPVIAA